LQTEQTDESGPLAALTRLDLAAHQPQAALDRISSVLAKHAADRTALILKAEVLSADGQAEPAEAAFQQTIQAAPTWSRGYYELAMAQLKRGHGDEAVHTLQQGVDRTHQDRDLVDNLGTVYERLGRPDAAISLYQGLLAKTPSVVFAANNLAMLLVTYRHDGASLSQAQKLADQLSATDVPTVIDTRGWVKFKSGDYHGAESLLQQAVDKSPNAPELRYHLAMAQLRSGESQAAQQNLESALQSTQSFNGIDDARARLAQLRKTGASG
jgi:tetratricopeptide (TPR) repeat protein